jgi:hypothetical protein
MEQIQPLVDIHPKQSIFGLVRKYSESCAVAGILMFSTFPLLGNALVYGTDRGRRGAQLLSFGLSATLMVLGFGHRAHDAWVRLRSNPRHPALIASYVAAAVLLLLLGVDLIRHPGIARDRNISIEPVLFLLWIGLFGAFGALKKYAIPPSRTSRGRPSYFKRLVLLAALMSAFAALTAWSKGPPMGEVYMSFGGSTVISGVCAAIAGFAVLFAFPGWAATVISAGFFFLMAMSTSRTIILVGFLFMILLNLRLLLSSKRNRSWAWVFGIIPFALFISILLTPALHESAKFPYLARQTTQYDTPRFYREEYIRRWSRLLRVLPFTSANDKTHEMTVLGFTVKLYRPEFYGKNGLGGGDLEDVLLNQAESGDSRTSIYLKSIQLISERPLGFWPENFSSYIGVNCEVHAVCKYPHNLFLEIGYYFGWIFFAATLLIWGYMGLILSKDLLISNSPATLMGTVATIGLMAQIQLSGNLQDSLIPLCATIAWILSRTSPIGNSPETAWHQ